MLPGPTNIIGRVTEAESKDTPRAPGQIGRRREPWPFVADDNHRLAAHVDLLPGVVENAVAAAPQTPAQERRLVPGIVVAENCQRCNPGPEFAEHRQDPAIMPV